MPIIPFISSKDVLVSWVYGMNSFYSDLESMHMRQPRWARWLWNAVFLLLIPAALTYMYTYSLIDMVPVAYGSYVYEDSVQAVGVFLLIIPLLFVAVYAIWFVAKTKYSGASWTEVLKISFATTEGWTKAQDNESDKASMVKKEEE